MLLYLWHLLGDIMNSEEQWFTGPLDYCTCGAPIYRMGDCVSSPFCCCNDPVDMAIPVSPVPELTDEMPDLECVIKKLMLTQKLIKPMTPVQRLAVKILEEL